MAERKFQVIGEKPISALTKRLQERWEALVRRRDRIAQLEAELEQASKKFYDCLEPRLELTPGERAAYRGLRMTDDGTLAMILCECPSCQAGVHNLSVTSVVEEMIRQELIQPEQAEDARQQALEIDAERRSAVKKSLLIN